MPKSEVQNPKPKTPKTRLRTRNPKPYRNPKAENPNPVSNLKPKIRNRFRIPKLRTGVRGEYTFRKEPKDNFLSTLEGSIPPPTLNPEL